MAALAAGLPFPNFASSLPIADRASLVGLSDNDVRGRCAAKADEYRRFALALLSIYNSIAPIHRLPPEILSQIFEGCWTDRKSLSIGQVCRQWRSVLLTTTAFWVDVINGDRFSPDKHSIVHLDAALERCAPRPVELSFSRFSRRVYNCLVPHAGRVVSLDVSMAEKSDLVALLALLHSGMSYLGTLTISFDKDGNPQHPAWTQNPQLESLSPPVLPRLTRLTAPPFLFPVLAVPSLCHITLEPWYERHSYVGPLGSLERFFKALATCSHNLRALELFRTSPWADLLLPHFALSLPMLRHLQITETTRDCTFILSHLALPNTTRIHCTNVDNGRLSTIIAANPDPMYASISATDRVEIRGTADHDRDSSAVSVHCYAGNEERLCLGIAAGDPSDGPGGGLRPDDTVDIFRARARVRELTVSALHRRDIQGVEFRAFPHLVRLAIAGQTAAHGLRHLARSADDGGVLSPVLETLAVDFHLALSRHGGLAAALGNGDLAVVEDDLRKACAELERVLSHRAQKGARLTRLEFGCTCTRDESGRAGSSDCGGVLDPAGPGWVSWRSIVEPLEGLVDGPVVFTGYRFFHS